MPQDKDVVVVGAQTAGGTASTARSVEALHEEALPSDDVRAPVPSEQDEETVDEAHGHDDVSKSKSEALNWALAL